jgi:hypothetical protein
MGRQAQAAVRCSLRSPRDLYFQIFEIEIARNADTELRVYANAAKSWEETFRRKLRL